MSEATDLEKIAECVKEGLSQFFVEGVTFEIVGNSPDAEKSDPTLTCSFGDKRILSILFTEEFASINGDIGHHDYCHPEFPNSMLHSIAKICKREENFERIQIEACEIASYDPKGGLGYFLSEMQGDVLLGRFMADNFFLVLPFMMSGKATSINEVKNWINSFKLTSVACYAEE